MDVHYVRHKQCNVGLKLNEQLFFLNLFWGHNGEAWGIGMAWSFNCMNLFFLSVPIAETTEAFTFKETTREYVKPGIILYGTLSDLPELRLHCRLLLKKSPVERNSDLSRTVGQLLTDSTFSDVTIFTGDASFPAHKNILAGIFLLEIGLNAGRDLKQGHSF